MSAEMSLTFTDEDDEVFTVEDTANGHMIALSVQTPGGDETRVLMYTASVYEIIEMMRKVADRQLGGA